MLCVFRVVFPGRTESWPSAGRKRILVVVSASMSLTGGAEHIAPLLALPLPFRFDGEFDGRGCNVLGIYI